MSARGKKLQLSSFQIILCSFAGVILLGAILLSLPFASAENYPPSFSDALFTSTSAVCVTGLVVRDTFQGWTLFGKCVIISLIQIGGMGVITIALLISCFAGRKISLFQRSVMKEAISAEKIGGIVRLTKRILRITFGCELLGALALYPVFLPEYGSLNACGYALFHSISAFCNAGFDLCGETAAYSSLTAYISNPLVNITIMLLIIIGGLGFRTWDDFFAYKGHFRRYSLQTKVILSTTFVLIITAALYFYCFEFGGLTGKDRILASLFQSVTPRTAGFNTVDQDALSDSGKMITIILMLIGGAPGSTAGGMKVTTAAILVFAAFSVFRHDEDTNLFKRRLEHEILRKAAALLLMYLILFLGSAMIISRLENLPLLSCMYETASAIGTVGLTLGLTPSLGRISQGILIFLMFFGRVGGLTIIFATFKSRIYGRKFPHEDISVG